MARPASVAFFCRANSCLLNFSASSAWAVVTVALILPASPKSLSSGATSRTLLPKSSWAMRARAPPSVRVLKPTDILSSASAGSIAWSCEALRPMESKALAASLPGLTSLSTPFIFTSAVPTVSRLVPLRRAMSSRPLKFSMLAPVASFKSLRASMPSILDLARAKNPPTLTALIKPRALVSRPALCCTEPKLVRTCCKTRLALSCALTVILVSATAVTFARA